MTGSFSSISEVKALHNCPLTLWICVIEVEAVDLVMVVYGLKRHPGDCMSTWHCRRTAFFLSKQVSESGHRQHLP